MKNTLRTLAAIDRGQRPQVAVNGRTSPPVALVEVPSASAPARESSKAAADIRFQRVRITMQVMSSCWRARPTNLSTEAIMAFNTSAALADWLLARTWSMRASP